MTLLAVARLVANKNRHSVSLAVMYLASDARCYPLVLTSLQCTAV